MAIVAQAKKDIKLREEARGEMKKASTKDDIQALINKRLAQSFADRPKAPEKPKEAPKPKTEAPKEAAPDPEATKKEAAAIVAAANKRLQAAAGGPREGQNGDGRGPSRR